MSPTTWGLKGHCGVEPPSFRGIQSAVHLADGLEGSALEGTFLGSPPELIRLLGE